MTRKPPLTSPAVCKIDDMALLAQTAGDVSGGFLVILDQQDLHTASIAPRFPLVAHTAGMAADNLAALRVDDHRLHARRAVGLDDYARFAVVDNDARIVGLAARPMLCDRDRLRQGQSSPLQSGLFLRLALGAAEGGP